MRKFHKTRGVDLAITAVALTVLTSELAWAGAVVPGPAAGGLIAGVAVIGALVIAKLRRRN